MRQSPMTWTRELDLKLIHLFDGPRDEMVAQMGMTYGQCMARHGRLRQDFTLPIAIRNRVRRQAEVAAAGRTEAATLGSRRYRAAVKTARAAAQALADASSCANIPAAIATVHPGASSGTASPNAPRDGRSRPSPT